MILGLIASFAGGSWDITYHILSKPESFFSYPHALVYSGILVVILVFVLTAKFNVKESKAPKRNFKIVFSGILLIISAGPFDFLWHLRFGLDGLLSPPHLALLTGWLLVAIGNLMIINTKLNLAYPDVFSDNNGTKTTSNFSLNKVNQKSQKNNGSSTFFAPFEVSNKFLLVTQLTLNLFILLMIFSGFLYFLSLPFSETKSYNFNPPSMVGLLVYGIGFPFLFSFYFQYIYSKYQFFRQIIPIVGIAYVGITLFTQITSNPYLVSVSGLYLLNLIPFFILYVSTTIQSKSILTGKITKKEEGSYFYSKLSKFLIILIIPVLTYSLSFPLNVYIYNEEFYGYLIYQNVVLNVYQQIINEFFIIVIPLSIVGGLLGFAIFNIISKSNQRKNNKVSDSSASV